VLAITTGVWARDATRFISLSDPVERPQGYL